VKDSDVIVNRLDKERLLDHLAAAPVAPPAERLRTILEQAAVVPPRRVPHDVVTMNTRLVIRDPRNGERETYVLTYPGIAVPAGVSVLSPLGSALFAAREGEEVQFMGARTARRIIVEQIEYQPERAGDYDL
jgi:regulator of nucleoside diphosphate kinase